MAGIADFLDSLIGGFDLICFCLVIGGLFWGLFILRPWSQHQGYNTELLDRTTSLIYKGGFYLAGAQLFKIILKIWLMTALLNKWPFPEFAATTQFHGGIVRTVLALVVASYCYLYLRKHPDSKSHWLTANLFALPMIISGAWLVHGAGRFESQIFLMSFTVVHQVAAAIWVGSIFQLVNLWLLRYRGKVSDTLWPRLLREFSPYGMGAVAAILISGLPIALKYIDTWNGLIGTGYGNLLTVKVILLTMALGYAWLNRSAVMNYGTTGNSYALTNRVPYFVEAETFVLVTLLFTAASLASQPPATDIPSLTATWQEVVNTFHPQVPQTSSPTHTDLIAGEAGRVAIVGKIPSVAATEWSNYNHNISGIFLTTMSFFAMLSYLRLSPALSQVRSFLRFSDYWPVGFILLGVFLFFRSDAETWPLGPIGFWESTFNNGEVLQHRIATLLVFTLGVIELSARFSKNPRMAFVYSFPVLSAFGGLMLLTHSHIGFEPKSAFLIQVGHTAMGVFSLILACGRWLELKLESPVKEIAGFVSVAALFQIGLILMFYREPLY
jgi:copper resistance protein D